MSWSVILSITAAVTLVADDAPATPTDDPWQPPVFQPTPAAAEPRTVTAAEPSPPPAPPPASKRKKPKKGKAGTTDTDKPPAPKWGKQRALARALALAEAERAAVDRSAELLLQDGRNDAAGELYMAAAAVHRDPVLYLHAVDAYLQSQGKQAPESTRRGQRALAGARTLLAAPGEGPPRFASTELPGLEQRSEQLAARLRGKSNALDRARRGRQELAVGASFLGVGLTGIAVLGVGFYLRAAGERERERVEGLPGLYDYSQVDAQDRRADAMIGAGAVTSVLGGALGIAMTVVGVRDLRLARGGGMRASLRLVPRPGGLSLVGRF